MNISELKNAVIDKLEQAQESTLKEVLAFIEFESSSEIYKVNNLEKKSIEIGLQQIEKGEYFSNEQVVMETETWLKA